jgi:hypothetical protein
LMVCSSSLVDLEVIAQSRSTWRSPGPT